MGAKRLGGRPGGKRLGGETTRGGNGLGRNVPDSADLSIRGTFQFSESCPSHDLDNGDFSLSKTFSANTSGKTSGRLKVVSVIFHLKSRELKLNGGLTAHHRISVVHSHNSGFSFFSVNTRACP